MTCNEAGPRSDSGRHKYPDLRARKELEDERTVNRPELAELANAHAVGFGCLGARTLSS
jgi:hypothetical protein